MTQAHLDLQVEMEDLARLVQQVLLDHLVLWLKERRFQDHLDLLVLMELQEFLVCLVQREKWVQEEIWAQEVLLEKMDFRVLQVLRARKEGLEMLESLVHKDRRVTQDLLVKWDHLESKEPLVYLDSLDNKEYQVFLVTR